VAEPTAMVLATAASDGTPGARSVLLKGLDERGLVFFTNLRSRKGRELAENPRAALVFAWRALQRQVVIDGTVAPVTVEESDAYWETRPPGSRLGALASPQSEPLASREVLERRYEEVAARYPVDAGVPPRPEWWGGLRVVPSQVELWQGRPDRLHDRLRYRLAGPGQWVVERLAP
jgi:pyridoxamine 5'-phosphate oxidase